MNDATRKGSYVLKIIPFMDFVTKNNSATAIVFKTLVSLILGAAGYIEANSEEYYEMIEQYIQIFSTNNKIKKEKIKIKSYVDKNNKIK